MLSLRTTTSMNAALHSDLDSALQRLLARRMEQLSRHIDRDLSEVVHFFVIQPGDTLRLINAEIGFNILQNLVDETVLGDPDFTPSFEWTMDHRGWFELVYILTDDGFGTIVFVQDDPGIEFDVHALCLEYALASDL